MHLRVLSRASALAVLQATLVERALTARWPDLTVERMTRSSTGDRDPQIDLWAATDKGLFTADLSQALARRRRPTWSCTPGRTCRRRAIRAPSWPPRSSAPTRATCCSSGARSCRTRPSTLNVLSSSPRRAWQIQGSAPRLLPWPVDGRSSRAGARQRADAAGQARERRRRCPDRGEGGARSAALERLAGRHRRGSARGAREMPVDGAAAEGASDGTRAGRARRRDRRGSTGPAGSCSRDLARADVGSGRSASAHSRIVRRRLPRGGRRDGARPRLRPRRERSRARRRRSRPRRGRSRRRAIFRRRRRRTSVWPRPDERGGARRRAVRVPMPSDEVGFWVARAEALPADWDVQAGQIVWAAGLRTWERLAARGVWVNGCADGLGDSEPREHRCARRPSGRVAASDARRIRRSGRARDLRRRGRRAADLSGRTHFFWTSGSAFARALARQPGIRSGWHASGPGRTARAIRETLGAEGRLSLWLDYDQWHTHVTS